MAQAAAPKGATHWEILSLRHLNDEAGGALAVAHANQHPVRLGEIQKRGRRGGRGASGWLPKEF